MKHFIDSEFPQADDLCYLNHAAVSPWPKRTATAVSEFAEENVIHGASFYPEWEALENQLRQQLQKLINAPSQEDIALVKNTSEGLSMIAYGLNWQPGDEIIISDQEFPSNRIVWESLKSQGVNVKEVALPLDEDELEQNIIAAFSDNTRMLAISSIQYASGIKLNLEKLGHHCQENKVLFCVDAIQSLGAFDMDIIANKADFVVADGHKWLMAPEGLALFYSKASVRQSMQVNEYGWHMLENAGDYSTKAWKIASNARMFECGSPNMLGVRGLHASLSLIEEYGIKQIEEDLKDITQHLREQLLKIPGCVIHEHQNTKYQSAIINFSIKGVDSETLQASLMNEKVICACRGQGVRFSPHFYTSRYTIDTAINRLKKILGKG